MTERDPKKALKESNNDILDQNLNINDKSRGKLSIYQKGKGPANENGGIYEASLS